MAENDKPAAAISALTKSAGFAKRVADFVQAGKKLIRQNEQDILIVDEARVIAEIIVRGRRAVPRTFWDRNALGMVTGDLAFFDTQRADATLTTTNLPLAGEFERDQIFFAKEFRAYLDPDMTQADKRVVMEDHMFVLRVDDRPIVEELLRDIPGGAGLDGELNNGVPMMSNAFVLPFYIRIPPGKRIDAFVKRIVALAGASNNLGLSMRGILGERK